VEESSNCFIKAVNKMLTHASAAIEGSIAFHKITTTMEKVYVSSIAQ